MTLGTIAATLLAVVPAAGAAGAADVMASQPEFAARGFRFLVGAYTVIWLVLAGYILSLSVRLRRLSQQVRRLKERSDP